MIDISEINRLLGIVSEPETPEERDEAWKRIVSYVKRHEALKKDLDRLSADMMNLPCQVNDADPFILENHHSQTIYKTGHRDARHAAAEKVNEFVSALEAAP